MLEGGGGFVSAPGAEKGMSDEEKKIMREELEANIRAELAENMRTQESSHSGDWDKARAANQAGIDEAKRDNDVKAKKIASTPHILNLNEVHPNQSSCHFAPVPVPLFRFSSVRLPSG